MSTTIDERVVSMQFDNAQFERNARTSINTLGQLKDSLNFDGASKGLNEVNSAAKGIDMSVLMNSVETVSSKFSAMQVVAITALSNITNSAINAGKQLVKSLSVDQITAGWTKYEQKTASVQTIMNATGLSIDEVSNYLDKLMWYSDETSYGFTDMTQSLAQLTAAGGDIDKLIPMIEGIANATAYAGKGTSEFSRAIYNLNQSYTAGYLQYMDWKSLELAGIASEQLKQTIIDTAVELGKISEGQITISNFGTTLSEKWADTEVMEKAFGKFSTLTEAAYEAVQAGQFDTAAEAIEALSANYDELAVKAFSSAQEAKSFTEAIEATKDAVSSGWLKTSEIIFGDYEEAKKLWTGLANTMWDIFASGAEKRNEVLTNALRTSGWTEILEQTGINDESALTYFITEAAKKHNVSVDEIIKKEGSLEAALRNGSISTDILKEAVNDLTVHRSKMSDEQLANMGYTKEEIAQLKEFNSEIQNGSISVEDLTEQLQKMSGRDLLIESVKNIYNGILSIIEPIKEAWSEIFPAVTAEQIYNIIKSIKELTDKFKLNEEQSDKLKRTFKGLFAALDIVWMLIKAVATGIVRIVGQFTGLGDGILSATASFGDFLVGLRDSIKEGNLFTKAMDVMVKAAAVLWKGVGNLKQGFKDFANSIKNMFNFPIFDKIKQALLWLWDVTKMVFGKIGEMISNTFNGEGNAIEAILGIISSGTLMVILAKISKITDFFKNLKKTAKDIVGTIVDGVKEIFEPFIETLEAVQTRLKAQALESIAKAVIMLVAALLVLSLIDTGKLLNALAGMAILFAEIILTVEYLGRMKLDKEQNRSLVQAIRSLTGIARAMLILAVALKILSTMSWAEMNRSLKAMAFSLATLIGSLWLIKTMKTNEAKGVYKLYELAILLIVLGGALKILSTMSWAEMNRSLKAMAFTLATLIGSLWLMKVMKTDEAKGVYKLLTIATGLLVVAGVLHLLALLSWDQIGRGLVAISAALAVLIGSLKLMSLLQTNKAKGLKKIKQLILTMAALGTILAALGLMSWGQIGRGLVAMSASLAVLIGSLFLIRKLQTEKSITGVAVLLELVGVLAVLGVVLKLLSTMSWDDIKRSMTTMSASLVLLISASAIISKFKMSNVSGAFTMLLMASSLALLASVLVPLAALSWAGIGKSLGTMLIALTALVGALAIMSKLGGTSMIAGAASLIVMAIAMGVLIPVIAALGSLPLAIIAKGILTIAAALAVFAITAKILGNASTALIKLAAGVALISAALIIFGVALGVIGAGIAAIGIGIAVFVDFVGTAAQGFVDAITVIFKGIAALIPAVATALGLGIIEFVKVIGDGASVIGEALVKIIIAALDALIETSDKLSEALFVTIVDALANLSEYLPEILRIILDMVLSALDALIDYTPEIVTKLVDLFVTLVENVAEALEGRLDSETILTFIKNVGLISALLVLLGNMAALVPAAMIGVVMLGLLLAEISLIIAAFGKLSEIKGLSSAIEAGGNLLQTIGTAIGQFIGGVIGGIAKGATSSLPAMASDLSAFMTNLTPFLEGLKSINSGMVQNAATLTALILSITAASIIDRLTAWLSGGSSMVDFASELGAFGEGIRDFATAVEGVDPTTVTAAAQAGKDLAEMAKAIPTKGGLWDLIAGTNDLKDFADQLPKFGEGVAKFAEKVKNVDPATVTAAANAGKTLGKMASSLPTTGGLWNAVKGEVSMDKFGSQLGSFGAALQTFDGYASTISEDNISKGAEAGKTLGKMASSLPTSGGIWNAVKGEVSMNKFSSDLMLFGEAIKVFVENVSGIGDVSVITDKVNALNECLRSFTLTGIEVLITLFNNSKTVMGAAVSEMLDYAITVVTNKTEPFVAAGKTFISKFVDAIKECKTTISDTFEDIIDAALSSINNKETYDEFYDAGKYLAQGLGAGIESKSSSVLSKVKAMAVSALKSVKETFDINSPSREFYTIGEYAGQGLVNAFSDYETRSYNAGSDMADSAVTGLQNAISKVSGLIENGIDSQPTIRPVLDLSDVQSGINTMNGLFGMAPSVGVMSRVGAISNSMSAGQNGGSDELLNAVKDLKTTLSDISGDTYNINGVSYSDNDEVAEAIRILTKAAIRERRA